MAACCIGTGHVFLVVTAEHCDCVAGLDECRCHLVSIGYHPTVHQLLAIRPGRQVRNRSTCLDHPLLLLPVLTSLASFKLHDPHWWIPMGWCFHIHLQQNHQIHQVCGTF